MISLTHSLTEACQNVLLSYRSVYFLTAFSLTKAPFFCLAFSLMKVHHNANWNWFWSRWNFLQFQISLWCQQALLIFFKKIIIKILLTLAHLHLVLITTKWQYFTAVLNKAMLTARSHLFFFNPVKKSHFIGFRWRPFIIHDFKQLVQYFLFPDGFEVTTATVLDYFSFLFP